MSTIFLLVQLDLVQPDLSSARPQTALSLPFVLRPYSQMQTPGWTGLHAFAAADTFCRAGDFMQRQRHRAGLLAGPAGDTGCRKCRGL